MMIDPYEPDLYALEHYAATPPGVPGPVTITTRDEEIDHARYRQAFTLVRARQGGRRWLIHDAHGELVTARITYHGALRGLWKAIELSDHPNANNFVVGDDVYATYRQWPIAVIARHSELWFTPTGCVRDDDEVVCEIFHSPTVPARFTHIQDHTTVHLTYHDAAAIISEHLTHDGRPYAEYIAHLITTQHCRTAYDDEPLADPHGRWL